MAAPGPLITTRFDATSTADEVLALDLATSYLGHFALSGFERRDYDPQAAYAQSKTAPSLFPVEATRRWGGRRRRGQRRQPGGVATGLQRDFTQKQKDYLAEPSRGSLEAVDNLARAYRNSLAQY